MLPRLAALLLLLGLAPHEPVPRSEPPQAPRRGVVVSCPRWGPIWGSPEMATSLAELKTLGVDWVAIHPYAWVKRDGTVDFRSAASLDFLERAVELSRQAGIELFWKPHLGYWGQFPWRGAIEFDNDDAWKRFFRQYRAFITDQAAFAEAHGVKLLAVGVELEGTTRFEAEWRRIVASVRAVYSGEILYAANWDGLDKVPFWDAVDTIGVHAYFPLVDASGADSPSRAAIRAGWSAPLDRLEKLAKHHRKPVVFAEIGYNVNPTAAAEPWAYEVEDSTENRELRRLLMEVAIERVETAAFVEGMFWWKWMPGPSHHRRNFSLRDPEARQTLARYWGPSGAAPPLTTAD